MSAEGDALVEAERILREEVVQDGDYGTRDVSVPVHVLRSLMVQLYAARRKLELAANAVDFWLDDGFLDDMTRDEEGRVDAVRIVVEELHRALGDNA